MIMMMIIEGPMRYEDSEQRINLIYQYFEAYLWNFFSHLFLFCLFHFLKKKNCGKSKMAWKRAGKRDEDSQRIKKLKLCDLFCDFFLQIFVIFFFRFF